MMTNETQIDKVDKIISSIEIKDDGFTGKMSFVDQTEISWAFDKDNSCCEYFGVIIDDPKLVGKTLVKFDLTQSDLIFNREIHKNAFSFSDWFKVDFQDGDTPHGQTLKFEFTDGSSWSIVFFNEHNGYYEHNLDVFENGKLKWNVSF